MEKIRRFFKGTIADDFLRVFKKEEREGKSRFLLIGGLFFTAFFALFLAISALGVLIYKSFLLLILKIKKPEIFNKSKNISLDDICWRDLAN